MPAAAIRPLAIVTGASSDIGYELARCCACGGFDLLIAADDAGIEEAAHSLQPLGAEVKAVRADLATHAGVEQLFGATYGRPVAALLANAGRGLGHAFLDQDFLEVRRVIDTNITGTLHLLQRVGRDMRARGDGRILVTGSIAGLMPGSFQAVYNGTKAFLDSFAAALRNELKDSGVSVTCLMPGPTDTDFFERAGMQDTRVAQGRKADPVDVAQAGFDAMMNGEAEVVPGLKLQVGVAHVTPASTLAEMHRKQAAPGTAPR